MGFRALVEVHSMPTGSPLHRLSLPGWVDTLEPRNGQSSLPEEGQPEEGMFLQALTVEELESRMLRSQQRSPQPIPELQLGDPQRTALLQRHSDSYAPPTSSRMSSFSLPAGEHRRDPCREYDFWQDLGFL